MPTYVFKGRNRLNEIVVGERVAADRSSLEAVLRREQVILTTAREKGREQGVAGCHSFERQRPLSACKRPQHRWDAAKFDQCKTQSGCAADRMDG